MHIYGNNTYIMYPCKIFIVKSIDGVLLMIFVAVVCALFLVLIFIKIDIGIKYLRTSHDHRIAVWIFRKRIKFELPFTGEDGEEDAWVTKLLKKIMAKKDEETDAAEKDLTNFERVKTNFQKGRHYYKEYNEVLKKAQQYIKHKMICEDFMFKMRLGVGDAALTGVSTGLVWGTIYNILALLSYIILFKKTDVNIDPDFNETRLDIKLHSIFTIRIVHIINVFFVILFSFIKILLLRKKRYLRTEREKNIHS